MLLGVPCLCYIFNIIYSYLTVSIFIVQASSPVVLELTHLLLFKVRSVGVCLGGVGEKWEKEDKPCLFCHNCACT